MNEHTDIERVLERWFDDGPTRMPDRVVTVVADRIDRQRQQRPWRLYWRPRPMNPTLKIGAAIATVVVIAVAGWTLLPIGPFEIGGPPATASPKPADTSSPSPTPSPLAYRWPGSLVAGTYTTSLIWDLPFEVEFTVPDGWSGYDVEISKTDSPSLSVEFVLVENTFEFPCEESVREPAVGPSVDDLVAALTFLPGLDASGPTPIEFDRWTRGVSVEYSISEAVDCTPAAFNLWDLPSERFMTGIPNGGDRKTATARIGRILILDVDGDRFVIRATWDSGVTQADRDEQQAIVDSIRIVRPELPDASAQPQPAP